MALKLTSGIDVCGLICEKSQPLGQQFDLEFLRPYLMRLRLVAELFEYFGLRVDPPRSTKLAEAPMKQSIQPPAVASHLGLMQFDFELPECFE